MGSEVSFDELASRVFLKNRDAMPIMFEPKRVNTGKDLAMMCYSLFMRGLVMLYGRDSRITLNAVTTEQLETVRAKLRLAHIDARVDTYDRETATVLGYIAADATEASVLSETFGNANGTGTGRDLADH
eukprot:6202264-Pyramimonas_sp.AAC.2